MKKTVNILLTTAVILPLVLLFWPFAQWNDVMAVILRMIPSLSLQALFCRIGKTNIIKAIPALLTGAFSAWGIYLYFTSPHWSNATVGGLIGDYVSPFICCILILITCILVKKQKQDK